MKKVVLNFFFFCFFFVFVSSLFPAQPTEKSLLEAWEQLQKNDPKTILFEKLEENRYRFKTERFPFDGELKIFNIIVEGGAIVENEEITQGIVELELVGVPEDFLKKHPYSYSSWTRNNRFSFDPGTQRWMSSGEYYKMRRKEFARPPRISFRYILSIFYYVLLFSFLLTAIYFLRKISRSNEQRVRESSVFYREVERILSDILVELKKRPRGDSFS